MMLKGDYYRYTLNGVEHKVPHQKLGSIPSDLPMESSKKLMSVKFFLKYLHDFFEVHSIDYTIYGTTLLGYDLFQGVHIFEPTIEIAMIYRNMEEFYSEIQRDGFHIDFSSPLLMVISGSFFSKTPMMKAYIYFIHQFEHPNYYHLSISYLHQCKTLKEITSVTPESYQDYQIQHIQFYQLFPYKKVLYEDFDLFIPNQPEEILSTLSLLKAKYLYSSTKDSSALAWDHSDPESCSASRQQSSKDTSEGSHASPTILNSILSTFLPL